MSLCHKIQCVCEAHFCYLIGNFVPDQVEPSGGSHCVGIESCRNCDPPQAESFASETLFDKENGR